MAGMKRVLPNRSMPEVDQNVVKQSEASSPLPAYFYNSAIETSANKATEHTQEQRTEVQCDGKTLT
jgi:hypothetical protein